MVIVKSYTGNRQDEKDKDERVELYQKLGSIQLSREMSVQKRVMGRAAAQMQGMRDWDADNGEHRNREGKERNGNHCGAQKEKGRIDLGEKGSRLDRLYVCVCVSIFASGSAVFVVVCVFGIWWQLVFDRVFVWHFVGMGLCARCVVWQDGGKGRREWGNRVTW